MTARSRKGNAMGYYRVIRARLDAIVASILLIARSAPARDLRQELTSFLADELHNIEREAAGERVIPDLDDEFSDI
jgi:hypothetical protein